MKKKAIQFLVILLIAVLLVSLTLAVASQLSPMFFWALAGVSAVFAFWILPKLELNH